MPEPPYPVALKPYGQALVELARRRPEVVCLSGDLTRQCEVDLFQAEFPDRFIQCGMAEANMLGVAGALARCGHLPFVHTFGVFATRRPLDQIISAIGYPRLPVRIIGFMPGISSPGGPSHQAIDDVALMRTVPGMTVLDVADAVEVRQVCAAIADLPGPVYVRLKRGEVPVIFDDDHVLSLTGAARPRVCFLPTASGDADHYVVRFYRRFSSLCEASHISMFRRDQGGRGVEDDLAVHLLAQDLIYVGGGNVVSMLGVWRAHGLDEVLRECWRRGIVLCGPSAGSLCWFDEALSAFHGAPRGVRGLGLLPYSNCVHYDAEPARRAEYHSLVAEGMCSGFAVEDGVALHYRGTRLHRVVSSRERGGAFHVQRVGEEVLETALDVKHLGERSATDRRGERASSVTQPAAPGVRAVALA